MRFNDLDLAPLILTNVAKEGYEVATPIQAGAIPPIMEGKDVLGCAQTGTGKTAAFALPLIHRLMTIEPEGRHRKLARVLILCPTRELAHQIAEGFGTYAKGSGLRGVTIYGGVSQGPQCRKLRDGVDVIIATPGRLLDLFEQGAVDLTAVQTLVLDEADRMLDMGFINDIRKIVAELPEQRQTLLFSATLPASITTLSKQLLNKPVTVKIESSAPTADLVKQWVYFVDPNGKADTLADLIESEGMYRTIVFTRTKHGADKLVRRLHERKIKSEAIHGNKSQNARQRALDNFRSNKVAVLVATDVAARGIDVDGVSHVVNFDLTHEPETYVHRIGRTARAGAEGSAISLCTSEELGWLRDIERLLGKQIDIAGETPDWATRRPGPTPRIGGGGGQRRGNYQGGRGQQRSAPKSYGYKATTTKPGKGTRKRPQGANA